MAMSFSRPDPSSPASVADAGFSTSRRGFDQAEVREFLRMIAAELGRMQERERFLERELRTAQSNPDLNSAQFDDAALTRLLGEETARVLTTARESAAEIRQKAEQAAAQMLSEAAVEAGRMREEAEIEASRRRADAASDAEAEVSMAKQQGREMVNEARAYRERVLSELARRRELAREQIEQLLQGRDRLMQSFERARIVAIDVVAELQPLGEPDEYVNLAPTTGPVPVMVPNSPRPDAVIEQTADEVEVEVEAEVEVEVEADDVVTEEAVVEAVVEAVDEEADEEVVELAVVEEVDAVEDTEVDDVVLETVEDADADADEDADDDVVVDLFARLRAEAVTVESVDEIADADADADVENVEDVEDVVVEAVVDVVVAGEPDQMADAEEDIETTPFEQRDADLTPIIVGAARKLKRVLADEQNEVLEALRRNEPVRSLDALLPPVADHIDRYASAISDDVSAAARAGAAMVAPPGSGPLRKADAAAATKAGDEVLGEWLVVPLRERLERCVLDGDGDNAGIGKRVRAVYREWKTQHIDEQLDDVIRTAHGRGVLAAIGTGTSVVWVCDDARQGCSDCDDNSLAGVISAGEAFPTGHLCTPAHIGCRCILLPAGR
jgi:DivIVA domain-containing protein